jgi:hypothetical protein
MTLEDLEMKIRALPGVASDPHTVPALIALALEYADGARSETIRADFVHGEGSS